MATHGVVVGDLHSGSAVALAPEEFVCGDGTSVCASEEQLWLLGKWTEAWRRASVLASRSRSFKDRATLRHEKRVAFLNGDMVEGKYHRRRPQLSIVLPKDQVQMAVQLLKLAFDIYRPDASYGVSGTNFHSGNYGQYDEEVCKEVECIPDKNGKHARLWVALEVDGVKIDVRHARWMGNRQWTKGAVPGRMLAEYLSWCARMEQEPAKALFRSHGHRQGGGGTDHAPFYCYFTGAWQLATEYVINRGNVELSDIGFTTFRADRGDLEVEQVYWRPTDLEAYQFESLPWA